MKELSSHSSRNNTGKSAIIFFVIFTLLSGIPSHANELIQAVKKRDVQGVARLIQMGSDVDERGKDRQTPLWIAAAEGRTEIVTQLIKAKADVNAATGGGMTALWIASAAGHTEIVLQLITAKTRVNAATSSGVSPLWIASAEGRTEVVKTLIEANADVHRSSRRHNASLDGFDLRAHRDHPFIKGCRCEGIAWRII